jgi:hypothetical protein
MVVFTYDGGLPRGQAGLRVFVRLGSLGLNPLYPDISDHSIADSSSGGAHFGD